MPTRLTHLSAIEINGADAAAFLQSQLCSDIASLRSDRPQFSAWCKPNGRISALGWLFLREEGFVWFVPARCAKETVRLLGLYKLRSKVSITVSPHVVCDAGPYSLPDARSLGLFAQSETDGQRENNWMLEDIARGWPSLGDGERFLPQMLGLERAELAGLSLKKGCFPGQEVIARVHYKGEVKRELARYVDTQTPSLSEPSLPNGVELLQQAINTQQFCEFLVVIGKPAPPEITALQKDVTRMLERHDLLV